MDKISKAIPHSSAYPSFSGISSSIPLHAYHEFLSSCSWVQLISVSIEGAPDKSYNIKDYYSAIPVRQELPEGARLDKHYTLDPFSQCLLKKKIKTNFVRYLSDAPVLIYIGDSNNTVHIQRAFGPKTTVAVTTIGYKRQMKHPLALKFLEMSANWLTYDSVFVDPSMFEEEDKHQLDG